MILSRIGLILCIPILISGCAGMKASRFENSDNSPGPQKFFIGHTKSTGVIENRGGKPATRITTETRGVLRSGVLSIEQDVQTEGSQPVHRSWQLRQTDANHVEATASDMLGTVRGTLQGNYFTWSYRLKLNRQRGMVKCVRMTQMMYAMPDGQTMIIRSVIRKAGIIVAEVTEQFRKLE